METTPSHSPTYPPRLHRMQLILRLAAGQAVEHIAGLFQLAVAEVQHRASFRAVRSLVRSLRLLCGLPQDARLARLASRAARYITDSLQAERPGGERFQAMLWER